MKYPGDKDSKPEYIQLKSWDDAHVGQPVRVYWVNDRFKPGKIEHIGRHSARIRLTSGGWIQVEYLKQFTARTDK